METKYIAPFEAAQKRVSEIFENELLFMGLFGSQNYKMDSETSDFDLKAVILPTLDDFVEEHTKIHQVLTYPYGLIEVVDLKTFVGQLIKNSPNYLEILFSEAFWCNPYYASDVQWFLDNRERIAHINEEQQLKAFSGVFYNCLIDCFKEKESRHETLEKYGFASKQLAYSLRAMYMYKNYLTLPYEQIVTPKTEEQIQQFETFKALKYNTVKPPYDKEMAKKFVKEKEEEFKSLPPFKDFKPFDAECTKLLKEKTVEIYKKSVRRGKFYETY